MFNKYNVKLLIAFIIFAQATVLAQPAIQWDKTIGGYNTDNLALLVQTTDGGYLLGGNSISGIGGYKSEQTNTDSGESYWIVKVNAAGIKEWDKTIAPSNNVDQYETVDQWLVTAMETDDGGYILGGETDTYAWVIKLDGKRVIQWEKQLHGTDGDHITFTAMEQTFDGGCIIGLYTASDSSAAKSENQIGNKNSAPDYWVVKLSVDGKIEWDNTIGGTDSDRLYSLKQTSDGGYILAGDSYSGAAVDKTEASKGEFDYWIVKLDKSGVVRWDKTIGGSEQDLGNIKVLEASDGGYIVAGNSYSPKSGDKTTGAIGYWVVKLSIDGQIEWDKVLTGANHLKYFIKTSEGGYMLGGNVSGPAFGDRSEDSEGNYDMWIIKITADGTKMWDKTIGGKGSDYPSSVLQTSDGGYLLGGTSDADSDNTGEKTSKSIGGSDYWIVKLAPEDLLSVTSVRINAGGASFKTDIGKQFSADKYYSGIDRTSSIASGDILNTTNDVLYRSGRCSPSFSYNISVSNGQVNVILHFAEIWYGVLGRGVGGAGKRQFHVTMEGSRKLTNFDIFAAAGGAMRAVQKSIPVTVTDGVLNIDFLSGAADMPKISAIEVIRTSSTYEPIADAYIRDGSYNTTNFGATTSLDIKSNANDLSLRRSSYLRFQLPREDIISVKLRIYGHNHENSKKIAVHAYGVNNNVWVENGISNSNAPAASTPSLGYAAVNDVYKYYEIDVTSYIKVLQQSSGTMVSFLLADPNSRNTRVVFNSKENSSYPPELIIQIPPDVNSNTRISQQELIAKTSVVEGSTVYPNPVKDKFTVSLSVQHAGPICFELIDKSGNGYAIPYVENAKPGEKSEVDISSLSLNTGIYLLKINSDVFSEVVKVLIAE